jgi:monofunctional biosynthetic peptidoglycan transglycosylase
VAGWKRDNNVTRWQRWKRRVLFVVTGFFGLSIFFVALYGFLPPPITPLMVIRLFEGEGLHKSWMSYSNIAPNVFRAVIAAEDSRFCDHYGFDLEAIERAWNRNQKGRRIYGGSTISQQTAKNVFLWPGSSLVSRVIRKGFEVYFTALIELFWDKRRILEVYVNVIEFGPGIYGVGAAANAHFKSSADKLTNRQAALLAAVLPSPLRFSAGKPSGYVSRRAGTIQARMNDLPPPLGSSCPVGPFADRS